jgi:GDSL-like Lipase/Acylhydrolase family
MYAAAVSDERSKRRPSRGAVSVPGPPDSRPSSESGERRARRSGLVRAGLRGSRFAAPLALVASILVPAILIQTAAASGPHSTPPPRPCALLMTPDTVSATGTFAISASTDRPGCIEITVSGAATAPITLTETSTSSSLSTPVGSLTPVAGQASLVGGLEWSCEHTERTFQSTEELPGGGTQTATASVTTPSCANRLTVTIAPNRLHRGYPAAIAIRDRWHLGGLLVRTCQLRVSRAACPQIRLRSGDYASVLPLILRTAGTPQITVSDPYQRIQRRLHVSSSKPLLLATGDSEMQVLDDILASDLGSPGGARVVGDAHQSTAISSPFFFNWPAHAIGQVEGLHPDIVAMFLGGNEGFRLGSAECCGEAWVHEYANRVQRMMRLYLQNGAAIVYWFLIPTPSREPFVRVVRAVDQGVTIAASRFRSGVHVFDLRPVFSPHERYIDSLYYDGRTITVHEPDGFHLSASSDTIVAHMFIARLRRDGVLP